MRTLVLVAGALTLLLAASAQAKGLVSAKACGTDGCAPVQLGVHTVLGGPSAARPAKAEPFVRLRVGYGHPGPAERLLFLPGSGLMRFEGDPHARWVRMDTPEPFLAAAGRVEPFPAAQLPAQLVAPPAPQAPPATPADDGASTPWWLALLVVPIGLALALARRRHGRPATA